MDIATQQRLYEFLKGYISDNKKEKFDKVIDTRTRHFTVVLEDIYQSQNASAVLRTAECFGVQDIHVIEDKYKFDVNPDVVMGATKWLTLHKYRNAENNTATCFSALRNKGYKIVATSPHARGYTMYDLPLDQKTALVFGTELKGLSQYAMDNADDYVAIPLYGFTESFNISVTAALFIQYFTEKIRRQGINWGLTDDEKTEILLQWAKKSVAKSYLLEKYFIDNVL